MSVSISPNWLGLPVLLHTVVLGPHACNSHFPRSFCPDRTSVQARKYIGFSLGPKFTEAVILDLEDMVDESNCRIPLIALLSMGSDPTNEIEHLAKRMDVREFNTAGYHLAG